VFPSPGRTRAPPDPDALALALVNAYSAHDPALLEASGLDVTGNLKTGVRYVHALAERCNRCVCCVWLCVCGCM
jgi:hypothetical protein